ncbi:unnamed protein product [Lampetra fluviatilis]
MHVPGAAAPPVEFPGPFWHERRPSGALLHDGETTRNSTQQQQQQQQQLATTGPAPRSLLASAATCGAPLASACHSSLQDGGGTCLARVTCRTSVRLRAQAWPGWPALSSRVRSTMREEEAGGVTCSNAWAPAWCSFAGAQVAPDFLPQPGPHKGTIEDAGGSFVPTDSRLPR